MKYFTSDTHFGHTNVIGYCGRPFANVFEMNQVMLSRLQQALSDEDDLYFLGDWSMHQKYYALIKAIPCRHFYFVLGNHDKTGKLAQQIELDSLGSRVTIEMASATGWCRNIRIQVCVVPYLCNV
jgi:calcineurin-like phosphoesterase family protein